MFNTKLDALRQALDDYDATYDSCVISSSASQDTWDRHRKACAILGIGNGVGVSGFNQKPYIPRHLLTLIRAALDHAASTDNLNSAIEGVDLTTS